MKKVVFIFSLFALAIFITACANNNQTPRAGNQTAVPVIENETVNEPSGQEPAVSYSPEEIAKHASARDCWLLISGKVYDASKFVSGHPGGKAILEGCGKDASQLFETRPMGSNTPHSERARNLLADYYIGELAK